MIEGTSEMELLKAVVPELEAEGYEVFLQPSGSFLPSFLQEIRPDAIALSEKKI